MNRMCGSSQQAIHTAANAIAAGEMDFAIGCGVEIMSRTPMGSDMTGPSNWLPPPEEYSRGWLPLVKVFGPGAVVASVTVGTGETIFAPRLGAIYGYSMLWTVLAAVVVKAVLVYTGGRHLVLTGEHPVQAWRRLPLVGRWIPALLGLVIGISWGINRISYQVAVFLFALYAAMNELNSPEKKIITVEDPVEYRLPGLNQVQVHEKIDLSFARVLRSALRRIRTSSWSARCATRKPPRSACAPR